MANKFHLHLSVMTSAAVTGKHVREVVQRLIDLGLADAHETIESGEGDLEMAQLATDLNIGAPEEVLPGATREEVRSVMMQDIVGDYDVPSDVPEWGWVEANASFAHVRNGQDGLHEFVLNLSRTFADVPERLKPALAAAQRDAIGYLIIHQGT